MLAAGLGSATAFTVGTEGVDLVDEDYRGLVFAGEGEELPDESGKALGLDDLSWGWGGGLLFALAHPLGNNISGADAKQRVVDFGGNSLGEVALAGTRRSVEEDRARGFALPVVEVGESRWEDDGPLQFMFCWRQSCHVVPSDVGFLGHDG